MGVGNWSRTGVGVEYSSRTPASRVSASRTVKFLPWKASRGLSIDPVSEEFGICENDVSGAFVTVGNPTVCAGVVMRE